jgi:hypothetical protein
MFGRTQIAREFRKSVAEKGFDTKFWFGEEPVDGFDSDEIVTIASEPYLFLAKKLGINIRVSVETAGEPDHYVVTCDVLPGLKAGASRFTTEAYQTA